MWRHGSPYRGPSTSRSPRRSPVPARRILALHPRRSTGRQTLRHPQKHVRSGSEKAPKGKSTQTSAPTRHTASSSLPHAFIVNLKRRGLPQRTHPPMAPCSSPRIDGVRLPTRRFQLCEPPPLWPAQKEGRVDHKSSGSSVGNPIGP